MLKTDAPAAQVAGSCTKGRGDDSLLEPAEETSGSGLAVDLFWLTAALGLNLVFTARTMAPAFGPGDVVQDDARQHVFWMARFRDPELFPDDLIADYYQALAPPGYAALYWALSWVVDPLLASKLLPPVLGVLVVVFTFLLARRLHPQPTAAFFACGLLSWYLWQLDDLPSGTPRAFGPPFVAAQAWAFATGRMALGSGLVALSATFYPVAAALGLTLLGTMLIRLSGRRPSLTRERSAWLALVVAAALVAVVVLSGQSALSRFGPTVSASQAQAMPEFGPNGRNAFFADDSFNWIGNLRSGLDLRLADPGVPGRPLLGSLVLAGLFPFLLVLRRRLPAEARVRAESVILLQLTVASLALFMLAYLLLFRLYYPGRYPKAALPLVVAVAAGLVLGSLTTAIGRYAWSPITTPGWGPQGLRRSASTPQADRGLVAVRRWGRLPGDKLIAAVLSVAVASWLATSPPSNLKFFRSDQHPSVTGYLRRLPKDAMVAALPRDGNAIPTFARRSVVASQQFALALHLGYYGVIRQRIDDLIEAYYADSLQEAVQFAARYDVDVFVINRAAFRESTFESVWTGEAKGKWEPFTPAVARKLKRRERFPLLEVAQRCAVVNDRVLAVMTTNCLRSQAQRASATRSG